MPNKLIPALSVYLNMKDTENITGKEVLNGLKIALPNAGTAESARIRLDKIATGPGPEYSKEECSKELKRLRKKLFELQNVFNADQSTSLLIIFQGLDAAGKDGTIRRVMSGMNPMGVRVDPFKVPTAEELKHDFLWRLYPHLPAKGMIEVFNRSYYEDLIVPTFEKSLSKELLSQRYELINHLEDHLTRSKTHILKFFLHVSNEEQEKRIKERQKDPDKRYKFDPSDKIVASKWDGYIKIYDRVISTCNTPEWNIIPADKRWYRNYAVAKVVTEYMESLNLKYPKR